MIYHFGPYQLDASLPLLLSDGETIAIPPRAVAALTLLVQRRHTAVSKRELTEALWPESFVEEGSLAQLISTLRKVLSQGFDESPIQTIPKVGYRFVAEVQELPPTVPTDVAVAAKPGLVVSQLPGSTPSGVAIVSTPIQLTAFRSNRVTWFFGLVVFVSVLLTGYLTHREHLAAHVQRDQGSVAVLPFQDLTSSPESAWLGVAVQEMLATDLRINGGLHVLAMEDVHRALREVDSGASGNPGPAMLRNLGADLDCDHAVTGAYLLKGGRIRLDLRVVNLHTGETEQESSFSKPENELLTMLADVSDRTTRKLGVGLGGSDEVRALAAGINPAAYKLFAEGVARNQVYDFKGAIDLLHQATAIDSNFPMTHVELSTAWSARGQENPAIEEAERAQQLSGKLPREQQLLAQARVQSAKHQFAEAAETYRTLFDFFPDNREYGRLLIQALSSEGHSDEAMAEAQKLLAERKGKFADPLLFSVIADMFSNMGNWPKSLEWATRGAEESRRRGATILYERLLTTESQANLHIGRYAIAETQTHEALTLARQYSDASGELRALNRLGEIATAQQDWPAAESALNSAVKLERTYDQPQRETHTLLTLSRLKQSQGDLQKAYEYSNQALHIARQLGFVDATTEARLQMVVVEGVMGRRRDALVQLAEIRVEANHIHDTYLEQQAQRALETLKSIGAEK
jgi:DNA-binding winged helix-turn-helix (wHTH) protein/tetratricopeptide (TPR) repeat protein/TolB-like protein